MADSAQAAHSSIVGGSTAGRLLNCPGSYRATLSLPPSSDISSEYAAEGTAMHAVMERLAQMSKGHIANWRKHATALLGETFVDRKLTREHLDTMILPAIDALEELCDAYGGEFEIHGVEARVRFPGIPGAFGTVDLIMRSSTHVLHVDYKFGSGVGVKAVYEDDAGEYVNPQLLYYTAASLNTLRKLYVGGLKLIAAIVQPRSDTPLTHTEVFRREVRMFREDLEVSVMAALDRDPPRSRGEHCRFAPCKVNCPLWTGPLLDLSAIGKLPREQHLSPTVTPYGEYLARAKALVDIVAMFKKEVDEQLHSYLESGGIVPGWKLKAKTKVRQWIDDEVVAKELDALGFKTDEIWQFKLQTFQKTDATAKRLGVKIPDHLRVAPTTNETTVAPESDPAPAVQPHVAVEQFSNALQQLRQSILPDGSVAKAPAIAQVTTGEKR